MGRKRPTIEDMAAAAEVSRVLNGGHYVSPAALRAVNQAIRRTGYAANQHGRSLVTGRSGSVAFILRTTGISRNRTEHLRDAARLLAALQQAGRRMPDDVAVGGFDDSSAATVARPSLTTIRQPWRQISSEMVRLLLSHVGGEPQAAVILPTELVVRDST